MTFSNAPADIEAQISQAMGAQTNAFRRDVLAGLGAPRKTLPSRWLYDDHGSELFERITRLPEYYPTRTETAILERNAPSLAAFCGPRAVVIEYGAGASIKSEILLRALDQPRMYVPVDIAGDFLAAAAERLRTRFPGLDVLPVAGDFTRDVDLPTRIPADTRRIGFFPGSTIGNLAPAEAADFLARVHRHVTPQRADRATDRPASAPSSRALLGRALIGIDLVKPARILIPAYDDASGVTARFNLNLLTRINRELGATFDLDRFAHEARWNAAQSAIEMHLVANSDHKVSIAGTRFSFKRGETIHTESSRKYTLDGVAALAADAGWEVSETWTDPAKLFAIVGLSAT